MKGLKYMTAAAGCLIALAGSARADNVIARWIQVGPGSSDAALASGSYGDLPTSRTPTILARAIISGGACPSLTVDHRLSITMKVRVTGAQLTNTPGSTGANNANANGYPQYFVSSAATAPANFPDGTAKATTDWAECEAVVPPGHRTADMGGADLRLPMDKPKRILVIGDTGCRMSKANQQDCHSPTGFPFAALANYEALFKPDLIVHVGDYFYRDTTCIVPASGGVAAHEFVAGCSDPTNANYQPWGDTFDSWNHDLFFPGKTLLGTAPVVLAHANHESCGRGARGYYALIDPHPFDPTLGLVTCAFGTGSAAKNPVTTHAVYSADFEPTYIVPVGDVNLLVHDSSFANDAAVDANMATNYDYDMTALLNSLPADSLNIYMTHKPTFGLVSGAPTNGGDFTEQFAYTGAPTGIGSAFSGGVPAKIGMFLSGHIHQFEYVNFNDYVHYAPQLIVGVSGDNLDPTANPDGVTPTYAYQSQNFTVHDSTSTTTTATVNHAYSQAEFGFALLEARSNGFGDDSGDHDDSHGDHNGDHPGYIAHVFNIDGTKAGRCVITLNPRNIACWQ